MIFSNIKSVWSNNEREESEILNTPICTIKKHTNLFPSWVMVIRSGLEQTKI